MRSRLESIQVLRAFAALAVVYFHTEFRLGAWHPFGAFGVDIFFVTSGFIMALVCGGKTDRFFSKRLLRIVPLYWLITLAAFVGLITHPTFDPEVKRGINELMKSLFFIPYARADGTKFPLLIVGWTLNYEICFYLLISLAILVVPKKSVMLATVLLLISLVSIMHLIPQTVISGFYSNIIMYEFLAGIGSFWLYELVTSKQSVRLRPVLLAMVLLSIAFMSWYEGTRFYSPTGSRVGLGIPAFLLFQSVVLLSKSGWDLSYGPLVFLGDASYSIYLTHTFVVSALKHVVTVHFPWMGTTTFIGMLSALILSSLVAAAVHKSIDTPMRLYLERLLVSRRAVKSGSDS